MSLRSDHKALLFVGAIATLGAGVRVARATGRAGTPQPALALQAQAADSARAAAGAKRAKTKLRPRADSAGPSARSRQVTTWDRAHVNGKLDLDVATAAQIDSLPGVGPSLAKRIVLDRIARGPFLKPSALRRVKGVNPTLLERIDSLVTCSGTIAAPSPLDTVLPNRSAAGGRGGSGRRGAGKDSAAAARGLRSMRAPAPP